MRSDADRSGAQRPPWLGVALQTPDANVEAIPGCRRRVEAPSRLDDIRKLRPGPARSQTARRLRLRNGEPTRITSRTESTMAPAEITKDMMPGVVSGRCGTFVYLSLARYESEHFGYNPIRYPG